MKHFYLMLAMLFLGIQHQAYAEDDKVKIPDEQWCKIRTKVTHKEKQLNNYEKMHLSHFI